MSIKDELLRMSGVNPEKCMVCGKCSATCPNYDVMEFHPHQFVQMVEQGELEPLLKSSSLYSCLSCFACLERCPRQVEPAKLIEAVRTYVERYEAGDRLSVESAGKETDVPQQLLVSAFRKYKK